MTNGSEAALGFYGKLPTYGDFITRHLPRDFQDSWHEWLAGGLGAVREAMPENWMTFYLNCPAWKFALGPGLCGEQAVAGVTIPSVDRVGRYFNFTIVAVLPPGIQPLGLVNEHQDWFNSAEELALRILDEELDQDQIDVALDALTSTTVFSASPDIAIEDGASYLRSSSSGLATTVDQLQDMLHNLIAIRFPGHSFWWHGGTGDVAQQLLCCENMPDGQLFLDMLAGADAQADMQAEGEVAPEVDYMDQILSS